MMSHSARTSASTVGLRVASAVAGTLVLLLVVLAIVRPEMMGMAGLHQMMAAAGF